jgi:hypothetical protein
MARDFRLHRNRFLLHTINFFKSRKQQRTTWFDFSAIPAAGEVAAASLSSPHEPVDCHTPTAFAPHSTVSV